MQKRGLSVPLHLCVLCHKRCWWLSCSVMADSCDPLDCSPPGSWVLGTSQARILECVDVSFSRDLPDLGIEPVSPCFSFYAY